MSSAFPVCQHQPRRISFSGFSFIFQLTYFGDDKDLYCCPKTILSRKISVSNILNSARSRVRYRNSWEQPQHKSKTASRNTLCSPPCCFNYREGLKPHWRLQLTMGSHGIASILLSCNWVCFWSLILEGKGCYSFFFFLD